MITPEPSVGIGSVNRKASAEVVASLERARRKVSFNEEARYDIPWDALDLSDFVEAFSKAAGRTLDNTSFRNLGLAEEDRDGSNLRRHAGSHQPGATTRHPRT